MFHYQILEIASQFALKKSFENMRRAAEYFRRTLRCFIRSSGNETLCGMLDITSQTNVILKGEIIKAAKMSSFSSDFQRALIFFEFSI